MARTSRVYQFPDGPIMTTPVPGQSLLLWGSQVGANGVEWWSGDGTEIAPFLFDAPDPDAFATGDLVSESGSGISSGPVWLPGGSDGAHNYMVVVLSTGQWYIDQFDVGMTALITRWPIAGWFDLESTNGGYILQDVSSQMLIAGASKVVVVGDHVKQPVSFIEGDIAEWIEVVVFDTSGTETVRYQYPQYVNVFQGNDTIQSGTALALSSDESQLFYGRNNYVTGTTSMVQVDLSTGDSIDLFDFQTVDDYLNVQPNWSGFLSYPAGISVVDDGDFIIVGSTGMVRVHADGTVLWFNDGSHFQPVISTNDVFSDIWTTCALSGHKTFWASRQLFGYADEFDYDGNYIQAIVIPEPVVHMWVAKSLVGQSQVGPYSVRVATALNTSRVRYI